ncbi:MAG: tripartite tricarboxylate transporter substrate-binding protein [Sulfurospirillaceae bacterium]|nr:tripartite tricarboxylate transporter substrate-binding protein [Sulfurospirillaceae bacterium]
MKRFFLAIVILSGILFASDHYPSKPINFVVGLGKGGSADRMARNMGIFLEQELHTPIHIINKSNNASLDAANYVLSQPPDGYTVFVSSFSPYLINTIVTGKARYSLDDFAFINLQWFDYDLFLVDKNSKIKSIMGLIHQIKEHPGSIRVAVVYQSSGHLIMKLLLKTFKIPLSSIRFEFFKGGKLAREALLKSKADLLVISAQGSERYRKEIKPLAIVSNKKSRRWDAPTLNHAISKSYMHIPVLNGPIKGFAVSKKFKKKYPKRYLILENAIKKVLAEVRVQKMLKEKHIGSVWIGSRTSTKILKDQYDFFEKHKDLLKD